MTFPTKGLTAAVGSTVILALAAGFAPVQAQQTQEQTQSPAVPEVDDATLRAFAQASLDVEEVISKWKPLIEQAGDDEVEQLRNQANQEMVHAVQSNGLEIDAYNEIYQLAQVNPEVATTIQRYRQETQ